MAWKLSGPQALAERPGASFHWTRSWPDDPSEQPQFAQALSKKILSIRAALPSILQPSTDEPDPRFLNDLHDTAIRCSLNHAKLAGERSVAKTPTGCRAKGVHLTESDGSILGTSPDGSPWKGRLCRLAEPSPDQIAPAFEAALAELWDGEAWHMRQGMTGLPRGKALLTLEKLSCGWKDWPIMAQYCSEAFSLGATAAIAGSLGLSERRLREIDRAASFDPEASLASINALSSGMGRAESSPGAAALAAALWRGAGLPGIPGEDALGALRSALRERFSLTSGGWKALVLAAESAGPARVAEFSSNLLKMTSDPHYFRGWAPSPETALAQTLSRFASACSANRSPEQGALLLSCLSGFGGPPPVGPLMDGLLTSAALPPPAWRDAVDNPAPETQAAWALFRSRLRLGNPPLLDPGSIEAALERGWAPEPDEAIILDFHAEIRARQDKFHLLFVAVAERALQWRDLGLSSEAIDAEFDPVFDMARDPEPGFWNRYPGGGWPRLERMASQWHDLVSERKASSHRWDPCGLELPALPGGFLAEELTDGGALHQEGKALRHCVTSYADRCRSGHCRIFSLRDPETGAPRATLEFIERRRSPDGAWDGALLAQARGFANSRLEGPAKAAAEALSGFLSSARLAPHQPPAPEVKPPSPR